MNMTRYALTKPKILTLLGVLSLAIVTALGFFLKSGLIAAEDTDALNDFIARRTEVATAFFTLISTIFDPAGTIILSLLIGFTLWVTTKNWKTCALIFGSVALSAAITYSLKIAFHRSRPPLLDHLVDETDYSFPSGHVTGTTALFFALAVILTLGAARRSTRVLIWLASALIIAAVVASRLYLGVHWFTDTAAGALVGTGTVLILSAALFKNTARRQKNL